MAKTRTKTRNPLPLPNQRLGELLKRLTEQGLSQSDVARRAAVPSQYLSDALHGRRNVTELFARRVGEEFGVDHEWILGASNSPDRPLIRVPGAGVSSMLLPLCDVPVAGDARQDSRWEGSTLELAGLAASRAAQAVQPYVLRFGHKDSKDRLKEGDLVLLSQTPNERAELSVVSNGKRMFIARRENDRWVQAATGKPLPGDWTIIGHCVAVVWSPLI